MAGALLVVAPGQHEAAVALELLHAPDRAFGRIEMALAIEGQKVRTADSRLRRRVATELARLHAIATPSADRLALRRQSLHASVHLVGHIQRSVGTKRNPAR